MIAFLAAISLTTAVANDGNTLQIDTRGKGQRLEDTGLSSGKRCPNLLPRFARELFDPYLACCHALRQPLYQTRRA